MLVFPNGWFRLAQGPTHHLGAPFLKLSGNGHKDLGRDWDESLRCFPSPAVKSPKLEWDRLGKE